MSVPASFKLHHIQGDSKLIGHGLSSEDESLYESEPSVYETLQEIQKDNPQIETIFIDSDEDERNLIKPSIRERSNGNGYSTAPFTVRKVPYNKVPSSLIRHSNAIPLPTDSGNSQPTKFLVIPDDILPAFQKANNPISLNVPGIGTYLIPSPSEFVKTEAKRNEVLQYSDKEYDPLYDPKYSCWRNRKGVKMNSDGLAEQDRIGFYKAEVRRSELCEARLHELIYNIENSMKGLTNAPKVTAPLRLWKKNTIIYDTINQSSSSDDSSGSDWELSEEDLSFIDNFKKHRPISSSDSSDDDSSYVPSPPRGRKRPRPRKDDADTFREKRGPGRPPLLKKANFDEPVVKKRRGRPRKYPLPADDESIKIEEPILITTLSEFYKQLDMKKPLLVVNDTQLISSNLNPFAPKSNIVFPLNQLSYLTTGMKRTVSTLQVKLVKPDILCNFLTSESDNV